MAEAEAPVLLCRPAMAVLGLNQFSVLTHLCCAVYINTQDRARDVLGAGGGWTIELAKFKSWRMDSN